MTEQGFNRRDLLRLAGGVGLAAMAAGCATPHTDSVARSPSPTPANPVTPVATTVSASTPAKLPGPVPSETPAPVSGFLLCREAWGARPARPGGRPHTVNRMTIHHSAVALPDNRAITERLRQHQRYHQDDKGWIDIAYHAAVDRDGNIFALRDYNLAGDTATDYDTWGHFLVLCEGNFDEETVSEAQLDGAALVCAWATRQFGISAATLATHREVTPVTSCPGDDLEARVVSGDLGARIEALISTGFDLTRVCGQAADQIVAGIEAGR